MKKTAVKKHGIIIDPRIINKRRSSSTGATLCKILVKISSRNPKDDKRCIVYLGSDGDGGYQVTGSSNVPNPFNSQQDAKRAFTAFVKDIRNAPKRTNIICKYSQM